MYQETSQIHLNLSSIERTKDKKSNGHLPLALPRVKFFRYTGIYFLAKQDRVYNRGVYWLGDVENVGRQVLNM